MSENTSSTPAFTSVICNSRMPGVSTSQPPAGRRCSARPEVVWRPLSSSSRMPCVAIRSEPVSVLTSVDLPTPDEPTSATVWPRAHHGASRAALCGAAGVDDLDQDARNEVGRRLHEVLRVVGEVGLGQHDDRRHLGLARQRQIALQPRGVEILVARRDDEQRVDIGRDELQLAAGSRGAALEQAGAPQQAARPRRARHPAAASRPRWQRTLHRRRCRRTARSAYRRRALPHGCGRDGPPSRARG